MKPKAWTILSGAAGGRLATALAAGVSSAAVILVLKTGPGRELPLGWMFFGALVAAGAVLVGPARPAAWLRLGPLGRKALVAWALLVSVLAFLSEHIFIGERYAAFTLSDASEFVMLILGGAAVIFMGNILNLFFQPRPVPARAQEPNRSTRIDQEGRSSGPALLTLALVLAVLAWAGLSGQLEHDTKLFGAQSRRILSDLATLEAVYEQEHGQYSTDAEGLLSEGAVSVEPGVRVRIKSAGSSGWEAEVWSGELKLSRRYLDSQGGLQPVTPLE